MAKRQQNKIGTSNAGAVTFGDYSPASHHGTVAASPTPEASSGEKSQVFVIHGRDEEARRALFEYLRALNVEPREWEHLVRATGSAAPSLKDVIDRATREAQAVIALLTPDDIVELHPSLRSADEDIGERGACQARPNVFLELGMALALHAGHTIVLEAGTMRRPADLGGLNYVRMDPAGVWLNKVAARLEGAGCRVNRNGEDWRRVDRFAGLAAHQRAAHFPAA